MKDIAQPLDAEDFDQLELILQNYASPESIQNCAEMDGYLTAIATGPHMIMPNQWISAIFGSDEQVEKLEPADFEHLLNLCSRHMNSLLYVFLYEPTAFDPMTPRLTNDQNSFPEYSDWARGYERGLTQSGEALDSLPPKQEEELALLHIFAQSELRERVYQLPFEKAVQLIEKVKPTILSLSDFWYQERTRIKPQKTPDGKPAPVTDFRIKNEDPCPCGSGKTFNQCCGSSKKPN